MKPPVRPNRAVTETLGAIANDASASQLDEIERAITENKKGVQRLAAQASDPRIERPIPFLLSKIRNGAHHTCDARTDGLNERRTIHIPWDPALAEENAARARDLIARLTGQAPLDDDDIPGYGNHT
jgi:hypothetical protein